jgi:tripartite-type tricarboxylate transporter receptor subunit TctC
MKQKMLAGFVLAVAHLLAFQSAQAFPDRPIKLVVASPAGGPPDVMARLLSDKMTAILGQPVIVENRAGAGGTIGARSVAAAEPDRAGGLQECWLPRGNVRARRTYCG